MTLAHVFAPITKMEKQEDGSLLVRGIATDPTLDIDDQICDPAWLEKAMPDWFQWGNIREQHSHIAAGVATEYAPEGDVHHIAARVVDKGSVRKLEANVLKGFSIGIRNPRIVADKAAAGGRIIDGQIVEVSLVDRPANPAAVLTLAKAAGGDLVQVEEYTTPGGSMSTKTSTLGTAEVTIKSTEPTATKDAAVATLDAPAVTEVITEDQVPSVPTAETPSAVVTQDELRAMIEQLMAEAEARRVAAAEAPETPELTEADAEDGAEAEADEDADDTPKAATLSDVLDAIKALGSIITTQAEATTKATEATQALEGRVAKVEKAPKPTAVRVTQQLNASSDADALLVKAADYEAKANESTDRTLSEGYRTLAKEARDRATKLA